MTGRSKVAINHSGAEVFVVVMKFLKWKWSEGISISLKKQIQISQMKKKSDD